ncbi:prepilin-type N-terminal cleavage/methylation domain-containing protein [Pseudoalteromonas sp. MM17-2]|uniref:PulJ/GspJ family protein n=1 Tax=Pseudoalteromonas TaxID=53246 RepID=UPI00110A28AD|nr:MULTISPECIES: prepilin-type N-terminal cleavage/methylation domain-containing protein [Pseudoalteromonas]MCF2862038.1 prepilin-type N-terminal cleavage/methylation domain-containing protein [Pseudoalteromonas sp. CNAT2-18]MCG7543702.1 prepilin-type N-terminal cleavage/methylation domain-containing protein [Pseudoalteromonas sp. MM17-2]MCG7558193.1 prepilin-type N-terminal cleavage/methylation domain-containing protein [Pseudoalteromonas sp. CNAT2-18.1]TMO46484.1 hypothetical protein CWC24_10
MKYSSYNKAQGMTLIEVLIASLILFIAISAMTFVMRSSLLHEGRLNRAVELGLVAELLKDQITYEYTQQQQTQGQWRFKARNYQWQVSELEHKPAQRFISSEGQSDTPESGHIVLYQVRVYIETQETPLLEYRDVYWRF